MSTVVHKLEEPSNAFCTGKYNVNTSQQSTDTVQKFNSDLIKVSDLPLPALEKTVTATVSCFDSNPEFLSSCSDKSVIADSNLNTAGESCGVGVVSTCNRYDVATYRSKAPFISDIEKKDLIKNVFVPDDNFSFPETNRSFKSEWFKWFPWLCYSPSEDAVYCLACVLFGHKFPEKASRVKNFYSQPFRHWPAAVSACKVHAEGKKKNKESSNEPCQSLHSKTWPILSNIMAHLKGSGEEIEVMLTKNSDKEVQKNRNKLKPIVDTVILLGRLGLPFRGHRDDSQYHPNVGEYSSGGAGNFIECLGYRVRGGDTELENHLKTCSKNASYISKTSQNELICCCGKFIKDALIKDIKKVNFFPF